jgi:hypothetical protein
MKEPNRSGDHHLGLIKPRPYSNHYQCLYISSGRESISCTNLIWHLLGRCSFWPNKLLLGLSFARNATHLPGKVISCVICTIDLEFSL